MKMLVTGGDGYIGSVTVSNTISTTITIGDYSKSFTNIVITGTRCHEEQQGEKRHHVSVRHGKNQRRVATVSGLGESELMALAERIDVGQ